MQYIYNNKMKLNETLITLTYNKPEREDQKVEPSEAS